MGVHAGGGSTGRGSRVMRSRVGWTRRALARHRSLYAFALAHLVFGGLFIMQWVAIFEAILPLLVGWAPVLVGTVLLYVAITGPATRPIRRSLALIGRGDADAPRSMLVDVESGAMDALRSQYEEHIQQAARQEERTRLARDLHDAVKQQVFVIQTAAATIEARFESDATGAKGALEQVRRAAREAMTEMDAMIEQLQAAPVEANRAARARRSDHRIDGVGRRSTNDGGAARRSRGIHTKGC